MPKTTTPKAPKPPKVTYRQENGDDGYCYQLRVDGVARGYADLTRSQAMYEKRRFLRSWYEARGLPLPENLR